MFSYDPFPGAALIEMAAGDTTVGPTPIGEERLRILRQATVFAAITGPFADSLPELLVHQAA